MGCLGVLLGYQAETEGYPQAARLLPSRCIDPQAARQPCRGRGCLCSADKANVRDNGRPKASPARTKQPGAATEFLGACLTVIVGEFEGKRRDRRTSYYPSA